MSTVGLTKAMRHGLELASRGYIGLIKRPTWVRLREAGLVDPNGKLTPRGHAALAAPRMTDGQLVVLETLEADGGVYMYMRNSFDACCRKGWVTEDGGGLSPAGRTALNNVRAAMGSPDWKEGL